MPRKKRTIIDENIPDDSPSTGNDADLSDIIIVLSKVYKLNGPTRSFCFQTTESVDEMMIQAQYPNGGKYEVLSLNAMNETVNREIMDIEPKPMGAIPLGNGPSLSGSDIQVRMLLDELQFSRAMVLKMLENRSNGHETTPVAELIAGMQGLHALSSQKDPIELIMKGMDLANKTTGASSDWKSELIHTVKEAAIPVVTAISNMRQPVMVNPHSGNGASSNPSLPPAETIRMGVTWLKSKILKGLDPGLAVDMLLMNAEDEKYQPILTMAIRGSIDNFIELDAELANEPFRAWFTNAIQMLKDWYAEQNANDTDMDGRTGNIADVTINEKSGTRKPKIVKAV